MDIETRDLATIRPYERNPRKNTGGVDLVAKSIERYGWQQPIVVDNDGVIVAGHTRYLAAQKLGLAEVPVTVASKLTPAEVQEFRVADNKLNELTDWDWELLGLELEDIQTNMGEGFVLDLGFTEAELRNVLAADWTPPEKGDMPKREHAHQVSFQEDQWAVIEQAVKLVRNQQQDAEMTVPRALELICADYLA